MKGHSDYKDKIVKGWVRAGTGEKPRVGGAQGWAGVPGDGLEMREGESCDAGHLLSQ